MNDDEIRRRFNKIMDNQSCEVCGRHHDIREHTQQKMQDNEQEPTIDESSMEIIHDRMMRDIEHLVKRYREEFDGLKVDQVKVHLKQSDLWITYDID